MIHGLDTGFLVALELAEHADHAAARQLLATLISNGDLLAVAAQVMAEFMHIATDSRRFTKPLDMATANQVSQRWWTAKEVVHVFPDSGATQTFFAWLNQFSLGRKRILDTLLAATFHQAGIQSVLTTNPKDFAVFAVFTCITPAGTSPTP
jgi:predicted nucleic acid-binding protein